MRNFYFKLLPIFICFLIICFVDVASIYAGSVKGQVIDKTTKEPLPETILWIAGQFPRITADEEGRFTISNLPDGTYTLHASRIGYQKGQFTINVQGDLFKPIILELLPQPFWFSPVVVVGEREDAQGQLAIGVHKIAPPQVQNTPGALEDVLRTLTSLPGVTSQNDIFTPFAVRGGRPEHNMIVLDGVPVYNSYHLFGGLGLVSPNTTKDMTLFSGSFPIEYGNRLSAVLEVTTKEGTQGEWFKGYADLNITDMDFVLEGKLLPSLNGSWLLSGRRTYYDLLAEPLIDNKDGSTDLPSFRDFWGKVVLRPQERHHISISGFDAQEGFLFDSKKETESTENNTINRMMSVQWNWNRGPAEQGLRLTKLRTHVSWYRTAFAFDLLEESSTRAENRVHLGANVKALAFGERVTAQCSGAHSVEAGLGGNVLWTGVTFLNTEQRDEDFPQGLPAVDYLSQQDAFVTSYLYLRDTWQVSPRFLVQPGVRLDYSSLLDEGRLSPRLRLSFTLDEKTRLFLASGLHYQFPSYETFFDRLFSSDWLEIGGTSEGTFLNLDRDSAQGLRPERAVHYLGGIDIKLPKGWRGKIEGYYRDMDDLITEDPEAELLDQPINAVHGHGEGVEVLFEKKRLSSTDRLTGWLGYSWGRSRLQRFSRRYSGDFDQRHGIDAVFGYQVSSRFGLSSRWRYRTGLPYTPTIREVVGYREYTRTRRDRYGNIVEEIIVEPIYSFHEGERNSARFPAYHRFDIRFNFNTRFWGGDWTFYLEVINLFNRKNIFHYDKWGKSTESLPIIPTFGIMSRF